MNPWNEYRTNYWPIGILRVILWHPKLNTWTAWKVTPLWFWSEDDEGKDCVDL